MYEKPVRKGWLTRMRLSRTAAFHSATLLLAGAYLLFMSAVGYYVRYFGGDWGRALGELKGDHCAHSVAFNRGKRSIALDLKSADGIEVVKKIAAKAHVVMESFRPGVISRLGFGYDEIKKINPNVIYCSVSGFGQTGPYSKRPTVDGLIQAFSGMMVMNKMPDGTPWRQGMIAVDVTTGLYTFQALATALMRQFRYNEGCFIDSSLMRAAYALGVESWTTGYYRHDPRAAAP